MSKKKTTAIGKINLIVPEGGAIPLQFADRKGGVKHGAFTASVANKAAKLVDTSKLRDGLHQTVEQLQLILDDEVAARLKGWRLGTVQVSLALSAEGSIGIATAGVQAGIDLTFERAE